MKFIQGSSILRYNTLKKCNQNETIFWNKMIYMIIGLALFFFGLLVTPDYCYCSETWAYRYNGGTDGLIMNTLKRISDGYVTTGFLHKLPQGQDRTLLVMKTNLTGELLWSKTYDLPDSDSDFDSQGNSIVQTADGGFAVAGWTFPDVGGYEMWILKLDTNGNVEWEKYYTETKRAVSVRQTSDGGYIVAGIKGPIPGLASDILALLKLRTDGSIVWAKSYYFGMNTDFSGASETALSITSDSGYIVTIPGHPGTGNAPFFVVKFDSEGNVNWTKKYSGSSADACRSIKEISGGYVLAGRTTFGTNSGNLMALKIDSDGNAVWQKAYGTSVYQSGSDIYPTQDGGFVIGGQAYASEDDPYDGWIIKVNGSGDMIWENAFSYSKAYWELTQTILETPAGDYIALMRTWNSGAIIFEIDSSGGISDVLLESSKVNPTVTNLDLSITDVDPIATDITADITAVNTNAEIDFNPITAYDLSRTKFYVSSTGDCGNEQPCYDSIQAAVDDADTGSVILVKQGTYPESINLGNSKMILIKGGYDSNYEQQTANTTFIQAPGQTTIQAPSGSLKFQMLTIKN
ncbi:MAG: PQQ-binding-like beta-propeller repeat protein [Deltaproteobacteria bacterium]|nr:PQQ-binding-like beta-propeller repeat protein [Deltaproteobacteria bacterium]